METAAKNVVKHLINHHYQSSRNYARREFCLVFFQVFNQTVQTHNIRTITSVQLSTERCYEVIVMSLNRQMLTEIFSINITEKERSSSWLFCKVSLKYLKCTRQFSWKILMGCTVIILHMIFSKGLHIYRPIASISLEKVNNEGLNIIWISPAEVLCKRVLQICSKFTGEEHPRGNVIWIKCVFL